MAGMKIVGVATDARGNIDVEDLKARAAEFSAELAGLMVTYPSTHGVFESRIREIVDAVHDAGGQVYMDGANMNAQVGLTNPGFIGADICHLNLHKTFGMPHGGGGPGVGPICCARHLEPFLPSHPVVGVGGADGVTAVSSAPYGSALLLPITYGYIRMLGGDGLRRATEMAIVNANYMASAISGHFRTFYSGDNGRVGHEMILDLQHFKRDFGVETGDVARRLMDYGFHAPTLSFPVHDTFMVEPTESESKGEMDRFIAAMIAIESECRAAAEAGIGSPEYADNPVVNAPHTAAEIAGIYGTAGTASAAGAAGVASAAGAAGAAGTAGTAGAANAAGIEGANAANGGWKHPYTRAEAAYPAPWLRESKYFPVVSRIDAGWGDRNLVCTCGCLDPGPDTRPGPGAE